MAASSEVRNRFAAAFIRPSLHLGVTTHLEEENVPFAPVQQLGTLSTSMTDRLITAVREGAALKIVLSSRLEVRELFVFLNSFGLKPLRTVGGPRL